MLCVYCLLYGWAWLKLNVLPLWTLTLEVFQKKRWKRAFQMQLRIDCWSAGRRPRRAEMLLARISTSNFPLSTLTSSQTDTLSPHTLPLLRPEKQGGSWQSWVPFLLMGLLRSGIAFGVLCVRVCMCVCMCVCVIYMSSIKHNFRNLQRIDSLLPPLGKFI